MPNAYIRTVFSNFSKCAYKKENNVWMPKFKKSSPLFKFMKTSVITSLQKSYESEKRLKKGKSET